MSTSLGQRLIDRGIVQARQQDVLVRRGHRTCAWRRQRVARTGSPDPAQVTAG
jgi:hypothetical protein